MKKHFVAIILIFLCSCNTKSLIGTYHSTCELYGQSDLVLVLYPDKKFQYHIPFPLPQSLLQGTLRY